MKQYQKPFINFNSSQVILKQMLADPSLYYQFEFQFLIGNLKTINPFGQQIASCLFQFLIGNLKTKTILRKRNSLTNFNSSQVILKRVPLFPDQIIHQYFNSSQVILKRITTCYSIPYIIRFQFLIGNIKTRCLLILI